jgi:hypothetical protein
MVFIMHVPDLVFVYLAVALPSDTLLIAAGLAVEQFGYGFGFAASCCTWCWWPMASIKPPTCACTGFMARHDVAGDGSGWIRLSALFHLGLYFYPARVCDDAAGAAQQIWPPRFHYNTISTDSESGFGF